MPDAPAPFPDLSQLSPVEALAALATPLDITACVTRALHEDLNAAGDVTTAAMVPADAMARAAVRARTAGVVAGVPIALEVLRQAAPGVRASVHIQDGERVKEGESILSLDGPLAAMLWAERTLLNFLGLLSGVATLTAECVAAVQGTNAVICDTRKTIPGLRALQKYAVRCGGGQPHRLGLYDAMLVKDNHIAALMGAGSVGAARGADSAGAATFADAAAAIVRAAAALRAERPLRFAMVECDTLEQLDTLLALPPGSIDIALLDNMDLETLHHAVRHRDAAKSAMKLEASGGVRPGAVAQIAHAGVDRISIGALTHSAPCLDIGLDILPRA